MYRTLTLPVVVFLLLSGSVSAQTITSPGTRDSAGNKVPATEVYCRLPSGRSAPCGPEAPLAVATMPGATSQGGLAVFRVFSPAGTPAMVVKNAPGRLYSYNLCNTAGASRFVRFYDKASGPVSGTTVYAGPIVVSAGNCQQFTTSFGLMFSAGITMSITAAMGDNDSTPVTIGDVTGFLGYQ